MTELVLHPPARPPLVRRPSVLIGSIGVAVGTLSLLAFAGVRPPLSFPDLRLSLPSDSVKIFGSEGADGSVRAPATTTVSAIGPAFVAQPLLSVSSAPLSGSLVIAAPGASGMKDHSSPATPYVLGVATDPRGSGVGTLTTVGPPSGVISSAGTLVSTVDEAVSQVVDVKISKVLGPAVDAVAKVTAPVEKAARPATEKAEELLSALLPSDSP